MCRLLAIAAIGMAMAVPTHASAYESRGDGDQTRRVQEVKDPSTERKSPAAKSKSAPTKDDLENKDNGARTSAPPAASKRSILDIFRVVPI